MYLASDPFSFWYKFNRHSQHSFEKKKYKDRSRFSEGLTCVMLHLSEVEYQKNDRWHSVIPIFTSLSLWRGGGGGWSVIRMTPGQMAHSVIPIFSYFIMKGGGGGGGAEVKCNKNKP